MQSGTPVDDRGQSGFGAIIAPLSVEQFLADTFGRAPLHVQGKSGRFKDLLDWDGLARLLETQHLAPPRLELVKAGKAIPGERFLRPISSGIDRIDGGALSLLLDSGATAIINHIDNLLPAVGALADEIGDCLSARTAVNLYASWRSEHGFDAHWDYHDFIILQLAGRKQWTIHKPTRPDPLRGDAFEPLPEGAKPHCVETLEDGDALYLPRGWIHAPVPLDGPSMHLTIGIVRPTGAGFLAWLANELQEDPQVRAAIPLAGSGPARAEWERRIADIVDAAIAGGAVERYITIKDAKRGARPRFSFPDFGRAPQSEWQAATTFRSVSLHRLIIEDKGEGKASVTAMGRAWPCSSAVAAALARITSTVPVTLEALEAGLSPSDKAELRQMLELLVKFGLVATRSP